MPEQLRVAVTGGSGKVGRWIVRRLAERGHQVVNLDRVPGDEGVGRFIQCDVRERNAVAAGLRHCDAVCHLAEIPTSHIDMPREEIYWNNARAASVVLQTAADLKLRHAVYASSVQVYGSWGEHHVPPVRLPIDESCPVRPMNVYGASKAANEVFAHYLSRREKMGISIVRFPGVVATKEMEDGLWKYRDYNGKLADGMCTFIHASDLAEAFVMAVERNKEGCEVYSLSAEDILSVVPLRERLERHHPDFPALPEGWPDLKSPLLFEKAKKLLGWEPRWTFAKYLRERDCGDSRQIG
jgi:nucleoside-diphosphate-sugar epimerase